MNIAVYSHYFTPEIGAPSARIHDLAGHWLALGHRVEVVTCFPNHPAGRIYPGYRRGMYMGEVISGIKVHRHWTYITPNKGFVKKTLGHISYLPGALLLSAPRIDAPDVVIGTSPTFFAAMAAAATAARRDVPFVMEVRDLWPAIFVELGVLRSRRIIRMLERLEMALYRRAVRVITVTDSFRQNLIHRGIADEKVTTIPNGADVEFWRPPSGPSALREQMGLKERFVVLYIGAFGISQRLMQVLAAAEKLQEHDEIVFLFVGDGAERDELVRRAHEARLDNVRFLEPVTKDGVKEFYAAADVCLVPLRNIRLFETFIPSKMFEMMAMGRPIVGSVAGEAAEILRRSGGAVVVGPEDSDAIAAAILRLFHDCEQLSVMGQRGRAFVVANYSRAALAKRYVEVLKEIVRARDRSSV